MCCPKEGQGEAYETLYYYVVVRKIVRIGCRELSDVYVGPNTVGAGAAACALANRLSARNRRKVLFFEAGRVARSRWL